ncbi:MAG: endonuclease/exonuclease/phosphatase family protein [Sedimentisphaerales bacterium]|nr:endonuclease/exonuclease/phosphatase family protein [Sedimentisphaerales bacterium]
MIPFLCLPVSGAAGDERPSKGDLLVMSFNIRDGNANDGPNRWVNRRDMVCEVIRGYDADLVGLQEAHRFQIDRIVETLPEYAWIGVGREDGRRLGEHSAILYRKDRLELADAGTFWFSDTPEVPGSITWGNACTRICTWGRFVHAASGKPFYLYNLHLDHVSQPSREKSVVLLTQRIEQRASDDPVIVTGDFNAGESNYVVRYLTGGMVLALDDGRASSSPVPLVDTFRELYPDAAPVGTFNGFRGDRAGDKIDYILVEPGMRVVDAAILYDNENGRYPSDHFPIVASLSLTEAGPATYYLDSATGDDDNDGTSPDQAWRTLARANEHQFVPGDKLLFKAGTAYAGQFKPQGSGRAEAPIVVDRYGSGDKPRIDGGGILDAVLIENIEYWELNNLEVTNLGAQRADWRTGVRISANDCGTLHHIYLKDLYVHEVNGSNDKNREGCGVFFECKGRTQSRFDDLLIEDCHLVRTDRNGICGRSSFTNRRRNWFPSLNVVIRRNLLEDIGGDCIKPWGCDGCLVEYNVVRGGRQRAEDYAAGIWPWSCDNTVIQFNEVSGMKGTKDGQGFDSDYNSRNSLFQYNYSHDNDGGFMLVCSPRVSSGNVGTVDTMIRYNISQNDGARIFHISGPVSGTRIYNNLFFVPKDRDMHAVLFGNWDGYAQDTAFFNNIFYVEGKVRFDYGQSTGNIFQNNVFYGDIENRPDDPNAILTDPMLVAPGAGTAGRDSLNGYKLKEGSPCFGAGKPIDNPGTHDFWGTPLRKDGAPNIGPDARR